MFESPLTNVTFLKVAFGSAWAIRQGQLKYYNKREFSTQEIVLELTSLNTFNANSNISDYFPKNQVGLILEDTESNEVDSSGISKIFHRLRLHIYVP